VAWAECTKPPSTLHYVCATRGELAHLTGFALPVRVPKSLEGWSRSSTRCRCLRLVVVHATCYSLSDHLLGLRACLVAGRNLN